MKFNIGDKVKFLNELGGGVVTKIISPTMVSVAIEDGFDMPIMTNELILANVSDSAGKMFNADFSKTNELDFDTKSDEEIDYQNNDFERESLLNKFSSVRKDPLGIYLSYVPHDQVWLLKDNVDLYLINNTSYEVLYNFYLSPEENICNGKDYGSISANSKMYIDTITREDIGKWIKGVVQVMFHAEKDTRVIQPLNAQFSIKASRFFNKDSYIVSSFIEEKSVLINLGTISDSPQIHREIVNKYNELSIAETTIRNNVKDSSILEKFMVDSDSAEIDLHIESLVDNPQDIDAVQMLLIQTSNFNRYLEEAIKLKLKKIIFIHGVGVGRLKNEIKKILDQYSNIHYFDASMSKYGVGATEVWIKGSEV